MKNFLVLLTVTILIQCKITAADQYETKGNNFASKELSHQCRQRKSGHCKVISIADYNEEYVDLRDVGTEIPPGFTTKMKIEIDYQNKNLNSYKSNYGVNRVVEILFTKAKSLGTHYYRIVIGEKFNHLAFLNAQRGDNTTSEYCNFSPELPIWPYALEISITKNGTISVFETGQTEPFLFYEGEPIEINFMAMKSAVGSKAISKLVGFYDCSDLPGCGTFMKQSISGCREKHSSTSGGFRNFWKITELVKRKDKQHILFNQSFVASPGKQAMHVLLSESTYKGNNFVELSFSEHSVQITMSYDSPSGNFIKQVQTTRLNEAISSPFYLRLTITKDYITLSKYSEVDRLDQILVSLRACEYFVDHSLHFMAIASESLERSHFYFDCCPLGETNCTASGRKKYRVIEKEELLDSDCAIQDGFFADGLVTFIKTSLNTTKFSKVTSDIYDYFSQQPNNACNRFHNDWCPNDIETDTLICTSSSLRQDDVEQDDYEDDAEMSDQFLDKLTVFRLLVSK